MGGWVGRRAGGKLSGWVGGWVGGKLSGWVGGWHMQGGGGARARAPSGPAISSPPPPLPLALPSHHPPPPPPRQAIDLLDEAGSRVRIAAYQARREGGGRDALDAAAASYSELQQVMDTKEEAVKVRGRGWVGGWVSRERVRMPAFPNKNTTCTPPPPLSQDFLYEEAALLRARELELKSKLSGAPDEAPVVPVVGREHIEAVVSAWTGIPGGSSSSCGGTTRARLTPPSPRPPPSQPPTSGAHGRGRAGAAADAAAGARGPRDRAAGGCGLHLARAAALGVGAQAPGAPHRRAALLGAYGRGQDRAGKGARAPASPFPRLPTRACLPSLTPPHPTPRSPCRTTTLAARARWCAWTCPSTWSATASPSSSARPPAMWATARAASSPRRSGGSGCS